VTHRIGLYVCFLFPGFLWFLSVSRKTLEKPLKTASKKSEKSNKKERKKESKMVNR
jgi:hypothetical protein